MKRTCFIIFSIILLKASSTVYAGDSTSVKKNEFGTTINPFAVLILGGSLKNPEFGISYKRELKPTVFFRSYAGFSFRDIPNDFIDIRNDSMYTKDKYSYRERVFYERIGIEKRKQIRKNVNFILGADLVAKQVAQEYETIQATYVKDSVAPDPFDYRYYSDTIISRSEYNTFGIGAGVSAAFMFKLSQRLLLTAESRYNFYLTRRKLDRNEQIGEPTFKNTVSTSLNSENKLFLINVTASYRF
jgi:hypothetical protein